MKGVSPPHSLEGPGRPRQGFFVVGVPARVGGHPNGRVQTLGRESPLLEKGHLTSEALSQRAPAPGEGRADLGRGSRPRGSWLGVGRAGWRTSHPGVAAAAAAGTSRRPRSRWTRRSRPRCGPPASAWPPRRAPPPPALAPAAAPQPPAAPGRTAAPRRGTRRPGPAPAPARSCARPLAAWRVAGTARRARDTARARSGKAHGARAGLSARSS